MYCTRVRSFARFLCCRHQLSSNNLAQWHSSSLPLLLQEYIHSHLISPNRAQPQQELLLFSHSSLDRKFPNNNSNFNNRLLDNLSCSCSNLRSKCNSSKSLINISSISSNNSHNINRYSLKQRAISKLSDRPSLLLKQSQLYNLLSWNNSLRLFRHRSCSNHG